MRFAIAMLSFFALSAHAMLPTPTEKSPSGDVSYGKPQPIVMNAVSPIKTTLHAFLVKEVDGQETLIPVNVGTPVKSGDVLEYQALVTNHGSDRVRSLAITLDIPQEVELIGGISPAVGQASADAQTFVRMPIRANIGGQIQPLPLSYYRVLRLTLEDIGINGTAVAKYRARVK